MNNLSNDLKFQQQLQSLEEDEDINLLEYLYVLYRYIFLILFCVLIGLFGAYHYNKTLPLFYVSKTTFLIPGESGGNSEGGGLAKLMGVSGGGAGSTSGFIFMAMETDRLKNKIAARSDPCNPPLAENLQARELKRNGCHLAQIPLHLPSKVLAAQNNFIRSAAKPTDLWGA